jgi:hypothetical protein
MFLRIVTLILLTTIILKCIAIFIKWQSLSEEAPIISFLSLRQMIAIAIPIEGFVTWYIITNHDYYKKLLIIACLAGCFFSFHLSLLLTNYNKNCPCVGGVPDWLHISEKWTKAMIYGIVGFMLTGSYGLFILDCKKKKMIADKSVEKS